MQRLGLFQMTAILIGTTDLQKQIVVHWEEMLKGYKASIEKAQKEKDAIESQFGMLESEKTTLNKSLEQAKVAQDKAIAMAISLKSKQERLIRVAKDKVEEKLTKALFEANLQINKS